MPANALTSEALSIPNIPDSGTVACVVGDAISGAVQAGLFSQTTTLTRKPSGSSASISSNAFTPDTSGYYTVTVAVGNVTRTITVVAFPASALTQKIRPTDPGSPLVNRSTLQNVASDPRVTPANITAAMEGGATFSLSTLLGSFTGWGATDERR